MVRVGARLALISDGVSTRFRLEELRGLAPEEACKTIMDRHRRHDDDATVLIADLTS
jgi:negative regulator of sigma-B (phosphoserine phosphatase)